MEHVKLARRDARRQASERSGGPRGWAVAASMALGATCAFVGVALWLGMNGAKSTSVRTPPPPPAPHVAGRSRPAPLPPAVPMPTITPPPVAPSEPPSSTPASRTKKRKGQIEKVHRLDPNGETSPTTRVATTSTSTSTTSSTTSTTTTTTTTSTTTTPEPPTEPPVFNPEPSPSTQTTSWEDLSLVPAESEMRVPSEKDVYFPKLETALDETFKDVLQSGVLTPPPPPPPPPPPTQPAPTLPPVTQQREPVVVHQTFHHLLPFRHEYIHDERDPLLAPPSPPPSPPPYPYEIVSEPDNSLLSLVGDRIAVTQNWLTSVGAGKEWVELAGAVNESLYKGDMSPALMKLTEMYREASTSSAVVGASKPPNELSDLGSLASLGLLVFDVLLLRNVQLLARSEEGPTGEVAKQLMRDREVRALGSLFMSPREARRLMQEDSIVDDRFDEHRADSVTLEPTPADNNNNLAEGPTKIDVDGEEEADDDEKELTLGDVVHEVSSFVASAVRAVLNVGRAYRRSQMELSGKAVSARRDDVSVTTTPLDCMWTLYCRNLDKTAKLSGPYGFLAKLNGLGLRLLLNAVPLDQAIDVLVREASTGWGKLDCNTLFPRCSPEEAVPTVLRTAVTSPSTLL